MLYPVGTPTQPEIISIALSKLDIRNEDIFADIGCGSGAVSLRAAALGKHVYAIDSREEAIIATTLNMKEQGMNNISLLKGEASILLDDIDFNCAFIGGSRNITQVLDKLMKKAHIRFVVCAVRIETAALALEWMKNNHVLEELLQIQLSRGKELAGGTMFKPENPVFLIMGGT